MRRLSEIIWLQKALLPAMFGLLFIIAVYVAKELSPNYDDRKLRELQLLSDITPVYAKLTRVTTHRSSRFLDAGIYDYYISAAQFDEVRRFYIDSLTEQGWSLEEENIESSSNTISQAQKLNFKKDNYRLIIQYVGPPKNQSWNYCLSFLWS